MWAWDIAGAHYWTCLPTKKGGKPSPHGMDAASWRPRHHNFPGKPCPVGPSPAQQVLNYTGSCTVRGTAASIRAFCLTWQPIGVMFIGATLITWMRLPFSIPDVFSSAIRHGAVGRVCRVSAHVAHGPHTIPVIATESQQLRRPYGKNCDLECWWLKICFFL